MPGESTSGDRLRGDGRPAAEKAPAPSRSPSGTRTSLAEPRPPGVYLEIQFHPAAVRWGVHCWFLDRRQALWGASVGVLLALFVAFGVATSPWALAGLLRSSTYDRLLGERRALGERMQSLVAALDTVSEESEALDLEMRRIYLAYGLAESDLEGQGGYPFEASAVPESIYSGLVEHGLREQAAIGERLGVVAVFVQEVQAFEEANREQVRITPSRAPLRSAEFVLTSPFGTRRSPFTKKLDFHSGIDLAAALGTPIHAPADGEVVFAGRYQLRLGVAWWRYGNLIALRHGERYITLYGHCDEIAVRVGQKVEQGEVIGTVGDSGWSTSPHLHYEVRLVEGDAYEPVDPRIYILDHHWRDEELLLVRGRSAPDAGDFEPLPRAIRR